MMDAIFYSYLVCLTLIAWCQATTDENSFVHGPNITNNVQCVLVKKRNKSRYSTQLGTNETSKPCLLTFNDPDISAIFKLAQISTTNIVDIDIKFQSNTSNQEINETRWAWANKRGLDILSVFAIKQFVRMETAGRNLATRSLNVGREAAQLAVSENPPGCVLKENSTDFLAAELLKRLSFSGIKNKLCYKTSMDSWYSRCCKIKSFNYDRNGHQCYPRTVGTQFVRAFATLISVVSYFFVFSGGNFIFYMVVYLPWKSEFGSKWYHELNESPMSLSSIFSMLFWDGYGPYKSTVRRILLVTLVGYLNFSIRRIRSILSVTLFCFWVFFIFVELLGLLCAGSNQQKPSGYKLCIIPKSLFSATLHLQGAISLLTMPFNIKHWSERLQRLHDSTKNFLQSYGCSNTCIQKGIYFLLCLFYIPVTFVLCIGVVFFLFFVPFIPILLSHISNIRNPVQMIHSVLFVNSALLFGDILYYLHLAAILCISGIFLNIVYFFPYITFISVLSFYAWNFWKSVEEKYFTLKALIYEEVEDINNNSNNDNTNSNNDNTNSNNDNANSNNDNTNSNNNNDGSNNCDDDYEIVCVVSKELYDKIRERLLPYDENLFYFAVKLFFMVGFSYIALSLVRIFQASDASPAVQVLTSLSFGAIPYLLNIAVSRKGDEEKAAWKKQLRVRVKQQVIKLTTRNPDYLRIHLKKWPNKNDNENVIENIHKNDNESNVCGQEERSMNSEAKRSGRDGNSSSCENDIDLVEIRI